MKMFDFVDTEQNNNMNVILEVIENPDTPISTLKAILEKATSKNIIEPIKSKIMHSVNVEIERRNSVEITIFDFGDDKEKMLKAVEDPKTSSDVLDYVARNECKSNLKVFKAIANNPNAATNTLDLLAKTENGDDVCFAIANNPNTATNTLVFLSEKFQNQEMLNVIANHPHAPDVQFLQEIFLHEYDVNCLIELRKFLADIFELEKKTSVLNFSVVDNMLVEDIEKFLSSLSELEMNIIMSRWGYKESFKTFREIATINNLSQSRIEKIEKQIYKQFWRSARRVDVEVLCSHIEARITRNSIKLLLPNLSKCFDDEIKFYNFIKFYCNYRWSIQNAIEQIINLKVLKKDSSTTLKVTTNESICFKIPLPPEPLQFNTERISEIKTESKKVSAMLNAIYEQDETTPVAEKSEPQSTQSVLNLDETHLEIVKILATKPEWECNELQKIMKGMMIDGVLEHINEAFFDYCDEAFIEGDDPIEINVELYKEIFK